MSKLYTGPGINPLHLLEYVVRPTLEALDSVIPYTPQAAALLVGTAWVESRCGQNLQQEPGPAMSIYQIEPNTYTTHIMASLRKTKYHHLANEVGRLANIAVPLFDQLRGNLFYATAIARVNYYLDPKQVPTSLNDLYTFYRAVWKPGKPQPLQTFVDGVAKVHSQLSFPLRV